MGQVPIDRVIHNPDAIKVSNLIIEHRPGPDGKFAAVTDPSFPDRVMVRGVITHYELAEPDEDGKRAVKLENRQDLFNVPMSDKLRKSFARLFNEWRDEVASMYLKPDAGKELVFDGDMYVEVPTKKVLDTSESNSVSQKSK